MKGLTRGRGATRDRARPDVETPPDQNEAAKSPPADVRLQSQWTGGSRLATRAATIVLWSALVAGPIALALVVLLVMSLTGPSNPVAAPTTDRAGERAAVAEFAQRFVVVWLQTPQGQEKQLAEFVKVPSLVLAEAPSTAVQPATADVKQVGDGLWSITVGVTVTPPAAAGASPPTPTRRFFRVPVRYDAGALIAAALPSPVAAPPVAVAPELAYRYSARLTDPLATSVAGFLTALLTGVGDVTRYVSPGTAIAAVTPAPYTTVELADVMIDLDLPVNAPAPSAGDQRRVLVTASATAGPKQQIGVQYALTLVARAGRWEVKTVDPAPMTATTPGAPGVTPTG